MGIVAKYKFDGSVYADLIPEFNEEFTNYTITDEVEGNIITRTIESDSLPTDIRFGEYGNESSNRSLSLLNVLELDVSKLTKISYLFSNCESLLSVDATNWDMSNKTSFYYAFRKCYSLMEIKGIENWNTPKLTNVYYCFAECRFTELDLSNWNTERVNEFSAIFSSCTSLERLDISNWNLKSVTYIGYTFYRNNRLTDIGMIYCDKDTINLVASLLDNTIHRTIWVESDDILQYDQYDHITYKTQKVQDTVHLNNPLLKGDTIEVIDGKTYHVHRYEKVVLDGSEDWKIEQINGNLTRYYIDGDKGLIGFYPNSSKYSTTSTLFGTTFASWGNGVAGFYLDTTLSNRSWISIPTTIASTVSDLLSLLQANPTTVVYELKTPYYELISEEPLELTLLDTTDNTINNNSILPSNMSIANKELSTIAIKPSTTYTLAFDKSNEDSEVTIDICGGEQVTTVGNMVQLTTPSELGSGIRFISSDGCIINNVRLIEGGLVEKAIPKETFEGLQSSFDDGYIIGESYTPNNTRYISNESPTVTALNKIIPANTTFTVVFSTKQACKSCIRTALQFQSAANGGTIEYLSTAENLAYALNEGIHIIKPRTYDFDISYINIWWHTVEGVCEFDNIWIFEGDYTHLSEAELMRYIEKGTSHYEEEDFNHPGKYKVQYKVTGKNKFNGKLLENYKYTGNNMFNGSYIVDNTGQISNSLGISCNDSRSWNYASSQYKITLSPGKYLLQVKVITEGTSNHQGVRVIAENDEFLCGILGDAFNNNNIMSFELKKSTNVGILLKIYDGVFKVQLEEGTVATEYEPYKEDIKTYYLSLPFLEGDTIEDINGVATHVKRYEKVVLDGSEAWTNDSFTTNEVLTFYHLPTRNPYYSKMPLICDTLQYSQNYQEDISCICQKGKGINICIRKSLLSTQNVDGLKQWLSQNPTTVVYELASPIYEPISTESILCDSYVNGHLDVDTNIPIEKVQFRYFVKELAYLQPSTNYIIQFNSDNIGECQIGISGVYYIMSSVVKGRNTCNIITPSELVHKNIIIHGVGFNASNIQVVANALDDNGEVKEFDYFKGLKSSFEDGLVTDENDENYGKYKVECKIVGKNKFNPQIDESKSTSYSKGGCAISYSNGIFTLVGNTANDGTTETYCNTGFARQQLKPFTKYILSYKSDGIFGTNNNDSIEAFVFQVDSEDKTITSSVSPYRIKPEGTTFTTGETGMVAYRFDLNKNNTTHIFYDLQLEEGTQATSYEPYKESIHTLYLNSPLLKEDKIVVHNGKLCHYHKMGMVVLDGNSTILFRSIGDSVISFRFKLPDDARCTSNPNGIDKGYTFISNRLPLVDSTTKYGILDGTALHTYEGELLKVGYLSLLHEYITNDISNITWSAAQTNAKKWLQANPTTVVYE